MALINSTFQPAITRSNLIIETLEQGVNFEHIQHLVLVFLLLTLRSSLPAGLHNYPYALENDALIQSKYCSRIYLNAIE